MTPQKIGEINGRWAWMLKAVLIAAPVFGFLFSGIAIPWAIWVTTNIYDQRAQIIEFDRVTDDVSEIRRIVSALPPEDRRRRIGLLEAMAQNNVDDHTEIKIDLVQIMNALKIED